MRFIRSLLLTVGVAALATGAQAQTAPKPLSPWDAQIYAAAFAAAEQGEFAAAETQAAQASDPSLRGHLQLRKLLSPDHKATYSELAAWLESYGEHPEAARVHALALQRKPAGAPEPARPAAVGGARRWADLVGRPRPAAEGPSAAGRSARELFYSGETRAAYQAAAASGETWIAGLAAFRMGRFEEALRRFAAVARDGSESPWLRAAGGFWAARAATAGGSPEMAPEFLRQAAAYPTTFYGLIAERQLGLEPEIAPPPAELVEAARVTELVDLAPLVAKEARARRAAALVQVGELEDAAAELRLGLASARDETGRQAWLALASSAGVPLGEDGGRFRPADFPTPDLRPQGGFTLDPALVYAVVRQESRFNPRAGSRVGASGLMQLMPATAAEVAGNPRLRADPSPLHDPAFNLRLGQTYLAQLLRQAGVEGDLLRALAAYNGGRGAVLSTRRKLGADDDVLMHIESLPYAETRNYVERVMANYWIYRRLFGRDSATLDAVASGAATIDPRLDAAPTPKRFAGVDVQQGLQQ
ncbi:MAG: lytic transglycosylase domain-containing protein [Proteobacteria bacterium]|nr:lytic transglycosylase domain-containing protein [Pseudomonadota bacterium]